MSISDRIAYHIEELETARTPSSEHHILPEVRDDELAILDVGCGIGQTLVSLDANTGRNLVGVDIEVEGLVYGHSNFDSINYANCSAEALPFADKSFDMVISRVTLPYTHIPVALAEIHRVLKPGGRIWITLHPLGKTVGQLSSSLRQLRIKDIVFRTYVLFNGTLFHILGKQWRFPVGNRCESFQTNKSILAVLMQSGFQNSNIVRNRHFLATAEKQTTL